MTERIDHGRRRFLGASAATLAAAHLGLSGGADASERVSRELEAICRERTWINGSGLTLAEAQGKVVLADFWTFTCINWLRTLPDLRAWSRRYRDDLIVVGVHTPEFEFEHRIGDVQRAVQRLNLEYPVVVDNNLTIWNAFRNHYWPALYLIDARGRVRQRYFGEGGYASAERVIEQLLTEAGQSPGPKSPSPAPQGLELPADWANLKSPETYLGYARAQNFASPERVDRDRPRRYALPGRLALNQWALSGEWTIGPQALRRGQGAGAAALRFHARDLHLVMGLSGLGQSIRFRVTLDGVSPGAAHGLDVDEGGNGVANEQRLYQLVRQPGRVVDRTLTIEFAGDGVELFSFTFG